MKAADRRRLRRQLMGRRCPGCRSRNLSLYREHGRYLIRCDSCGRPQPVIPTT